MLVCTQIESGSIQFESIPFSLAEIVGTLVRVERPNAVASKSQDWPAFVRTDLALRLPCRGLALNAELDPAIPSVLYGDPTRVRQVLINFLTNGACTWSRFVASDQYRPCRCFCACAAIKFTKTGSVTVQVRVVPHKSEHEAERKRKQVRRLP
jgi:hypothetical protein